MSIFSQKQAGLSRSLLRLILGSEPAIMPAEAWACRGREPSRPSGAKIVAMDKTGLTAPLGLQTQSCFQRTKQAHGPCVSSRDPGGIHFQRTKRLYGPSCPLWPSVGIHFPKDKTGPAALTIPRGLQTQSCFQWTNEASSPSWPPHAILFPKDK